MKAKYLITFIMIAVINHLWGIDAKTNELTTQKNSKQMETITLVASITTKNGSEVQMLELLKQLVVKSRKEKGCIQYDLHLSVEKPNVFVMYEIWKSQEALNKHMQTVHFIGYKENSKEILESLDVLKLKKLD